MLSVSATNVELNEMPSPPVTAAVSSVLPSRGLPLSASVLPIRLPGSDRTGIVVVAWVFTVLAGIVGGGTAIVIVTAISTIFLYAAYGVVIFLGATTQEWLKFRVWSLGRWSKPVAYVAVFWVVVLMVLFSFPTSGNISWPFMVGIVVLLVLYYFGWARARFEGPKIMGAEAELTDLEREFEHAAEELGGASPA